MGRARAPAYGRSARGWGGDLAGRRYPDIRRRWFRQDGWGWGILLGMSAAHLLAFIALAFIVIVIPGPSVLFIVSRALASGRRVAVLSVLGNSAGEYLQVVAVAFGLGTLAEQSAELFTVMKLIGGAYLVCLGFKTFRERGRLATMLGSRAAPRADRVSFAQAAVVGVSNPKTVVFLAAILPGFTSPAAGSVPLQILFLGLIFSTIAILSDTSWALAAGATRARLARSPQRLRLVGGAGGIITMAIGTGLLLTGRKS